MRDPQRRGAGEGEGEGEHSRSPPVAQAAPRVFEQAIDSEHVKLVQRLESARQQALRAQRDEPAFFEGDHSKSTFGLPPRAEQGDALEDAVLDHTMQAKNLNSPMYTRLQY